MDLDVLAKLDLLDSQLQEEIAKPKKPNPPAFDRKRPHEDSAASSSDAAPPQDAFSEHIEGACSQEVKVLRAAAAARAAEGIRSQASTQSRLQRMWKDDSDRALASTPAAAPPTAAAAVGMSKAGSAAAALPSNGLRPAVSGGREPSLWDGIELPATAPLQQEQEPSLWDGIERPPKQLPPASKAEPEDEATVAGQKRKRRSKWDPEEDAAPAPKAAAMVQPEVWPETPLIAPGVRLPPGSAKFAEEKRREEFLRKKQAEAALQQKTGVVTKAPSPAIQHRTVAHVADDEEAAVQAAIEQMEAEHVAALHEKVLQQKSGAVSKAPSPATQLSKAPSPAIQLSKAASPAIQQTPAAPTEAEREAAAKAAAEQEAARREASIQAAVMQMHQQAQMIGQQSSPENTGLQSSPENTGLQSSGSINTTHIDAAAQRAALHEAAVQAAVKQMHQRANTGPPSSIKLPSAPKPSVFAGEEAAKAAVAAVGLRPAGAAHVPRGVVELQLQRQRDEEVERELELADQVHMEQEAVLAAQREAIAAQAAQAQEALRELTPEEEEEAKARFEKEQLQLWEQQLAVLQAQQEYQLQLQQAQEWQLQLMQWEVQQKRKVEGMERKAEEKKTGAAKGDPSKLRPGEVEKEVGPTPNYKVMLCKFFMEGNCQRGEHCGYAHSEEERLSFVGVREGDWRCLPCGNINFKKRKVCGMCQQPKPLEPWERPR